MITVLLSYWCEFIPFAFCGYASGYMHAIPVENLKSVSTVQYRIDSHFATKTSVLLGVM